MSLAAPGAAPDSTAYARAVLNILEDLHAERERMQAAQPAMEKQQVDPIPGVADAQAPLETAVKLQPQNAAAHYHLGVVYQRTGRKDDAAREFALRKEISDRNRQLADDVHTGIVGPQEPEP